MRVAGVDGCRGGWIAALLENGRLSVLVFKNTFPEVLELDAQVVGVDMPIGLPEKPPREADEAARRFLTGQAPAGVVFPTFPRDVIQAETHAKAVAVCRERGWPGISRQSYGLAWKILEVERYLDDRVVEVHPEVSFRALAGRPLGFSKHTWDGFFLRRRLLKGAGIVLPEKLGALPLIDVLDAAAAAWSAARYARGEGDLVLDSLHLRVY